MSHDRILNQLSDYLDGTLSATERQTVEAHLASCAGCSGRLRELKQIVQILKAQPALQPPESFYAGVRARIDARPVRRGLFIWNSGMKLAVTVCTVMLVVLVTHEIRKENPEVSRTIAVNEERQAMEKEVPVSVQNFAPEVPASSGRKAKRPSDYLDKATNDLKQRRPVVLKDEWKPELAPAASVGPEGDSTAPSNSAGPMTESADRLQAAPPSAPARLEEPRLAGRSMGVVAKSYGRDDGSDIDQREATVPGVGAVMKQALHKPERMFVIRNTAQWQALWPNAVPPVAVNFENSMVVAVYNTGSQTAKILRSDASPIILTVEYQVTPGTPTVDTQVSYLVIPKTGLPIQFKQISQ